MKKKNRKQLSNDRKGNFRIGRLDVRIFVKCIAIGLIVFNLPILCTTIIATVFNNKKEIQKRVKREETT